MVLERAPLENVTTLLQRYEKRVNKNPLHRAFNALFLLCAYAIVLYIPWLLLYHSAGAEMAANANTPGPCKYSFPNRCVPAEQCRFRLIKGCVARS